MKLNFKDGEKFLQNLLVGMETEFLIYRPSFFILYMGREQEDECIYPNYVQVYLPEYWLIGNEDEWFDRLDELGTVSPETFIEAFELTRLVHRTSSITEVQIVADSVSLLFDNGVEIKSYLPAGEYSEQVLMVSEASLSLGVGKKWFDFDGVEIWARDLPDL